MGILENIDSAAYDLERGRVNGLYVVSNNFTFVENGYAPSGYRMFDVYSYTTRVAVVSQDESGNCTTYVHYRAFDHSTTTTTSRRVRRFLSAMVGRIDWDALYKACRADNAPALINVREVA